MTAPHVSSPTHRPVPPQVELVDEGHSFGPSTHIEERVDLQAEGEGEAEKCGEEPVSQEACCE